MADKGERALLPEARNGWRSREKAKSAGNSGHLKWRIAKLYPFIVSLSSVIFSHFSVFRRHFWRLFEVSFISWFLLNIYLFIYFNFWFSRAMVPSPKKATRSSPRKKAWGSPSKALPKSIFVRFRISWQGDVILSKKDHKRGSFGISKGHFRKLAFFLENV